jgi:hypothetical protein
MKQVVTLKPNSKTVATLQKMVSMKKEHREVVIAKISISEQKSS